MSGCFFETRCSCNITGSRVGSISYKTVQTTCIININLLVNPPGLEQSGLMQYSGLTL